jgi:hypothetical protein
VVPVNKKKNETKQKPKKKTLFEKRGAVLPPDLPPNWRGSKTNQDNKEYARKERSEAHTLYIEASMDISHHIYEGVYNGEGV